MISSIELKNFQSHKQTELQFHPGVNAIIGSSDSGKTSILRSLFWAITNRPRGKAFISHWNKNKKGEPKDETSITVELENDSTIKRLLNSDFNGYKTTGYLFNDNQFEFEALKGDVPETIQNAFNLTDVNMQKQMDAPFLLSESGGDVARFFNKIIRLDLIDRVLSAAEKLKRSIKKDLVDCDADINSIEKETEKFIWIEEAKKLEIKTTKVNERCQRILSDISSLSEIVIKIQHDEEIFNKFKSITDCEKLIKTIEKENNKAVTLKEQMKKMSALISAVKELHQGLKTTPDFSNSNINKLISDIEKEEDINHTLLKNKGQIIILKNSFEGQMSIITEAEKELKKLISQLPEQCPLCGGTMKGGTL